MDNLTKLFLYIPGIIIFLVGSGEVRRWMRMRRKGSCYYGTVVSCNHVHKQDSKKRDLENYYNTVVEYRNTDRGNMVRKVIRSATQYADNQPVRIYIDNNQVQLVEMEEVTVFNPWAMMIGGALLILLALYTNQNKEIPAMVCLSLVLMGIGGVLIYHYVSLKKRNLQPITGKVIGTYKRQISKETKIVRGSKFTIYPIVKYTINDKEYIRKCNLNANSENSFPEGSDFILYYDPAKDVVIETCAKKAYFIFGIIILLVGILAGASILSVIL